MAISTAASRSHWSQQTEFFLNAEFEEIESRIKWFQLNIDPVPQLRKISAVVIDLLKSLEGDFSVIQQDLKATDGEKQERFIALYQRVLTFERRLGSQDKIGQYSVIIRASDTVSKDDIDALQKKYDATVPYSVMIKEELEEKRATLTNYLFDLIQNVKNRMWRIIKTKDTLECRSLDNLVNSIFWKVTTEQITESAEDQKLLSDCSDLLRSTPHYVYQFQGNRSATVKVISGFLQKASSENGNWDVISKLFTMAIANNWMRITYQDLTFDRELIELFIDAGMPIRFSQMRAISDVVINGESGDSSNNVGYDKQLQHFQRMLAFSFMTAHESSLLCASTFRAAFNVDLIRKPLLSYIFESGCAFSSIDIFGEEIAEVVQNVISTRCYVRSEQLIQAIREINIFVPDLIALIASYFAETVNRMNPDTRKDALKLLQY